MNKYALLERIECGPYNLSDYYAASEDWETRLEDLLEHEDIRVVGMSSDMRSIALCTIINGHMLNPIKMQYITDDLRLESLRTEVTSTEKLYENLGEKLDEVRERYRKAAKEIYERNT